MLDRLHRLAIDEIQSQICVQWTVVIVTRSAGSFSNIVNYTFSSTSALKYAAVTDALHTFVDFRYSMTLSSEQSSTESASSFSI
jgi:hypothetical protein